MSKNENKKFPVAAIILSGVAIILAVLAISFYATSSNAGGLAPLGVLELVGSVLFLAALTTGRSIFSRVVSILSLVAMIVASFVLVIVKIYAQDVALLAVSLLMLVVSILSLIYFLTSYRNKRLTKMYIIAGYIFALLVFIYAGFYMGSDLAYVASANPQEHAKPLVDNYFLIFGLGVLATVPATIRLTLKDEEQEEDEVVEQAAE